MYSGKSHNPTLDMEGLRRQGGERLRNLREARGLSQADLVARMEFGTQGFYSQIETGRRRVPPNLYEAYAAVLEVERATFMKMLLRFNDPTIYVMLFGSEEPTLGETVEVGVQPSAPKLCGSEAKPR